VDTLKFELTSINCNRQFSWSSYCGRLGKCLSERQLLRTAVAQKCEACISYPFPV